jgi:hypothetical protein
VLFNTGGCRIPIRDKLNRAHKVKLSRHLVFLA